MRLMKTESDVGLFYFLSQVLGFAAFFALVLKKVDQEEYGEPQIDESIRDAGMFLLLLFHFPFL